MEEMNMPDDLATDPNAEARQRYGIEDVPGEAMGNFSPILTAGNPSFFKLRAQLLDDGRDIVPLAETENLWTWIKVYASGGENVLHAHTSEDHMFIVLSGKAIFYGPNKEEKELGRNEGLMLPAGTSYYFNCSSENPLVLLRVGSRANDGDLKHRLGPDGKKIRGGSKKNKWKAPVRRDGEYYE
jgi:mannose-6-phosphate isomerase-like protein (cupin superfamily)